MLSSNMLSWRRIKMGKWGILTPQPERSGPFPRPAGRLDAAPRAVRPEGGIKPAQGRGNGLELKG